MDIRKFAVTGATREPGRTGIFSRSITTVAEQQSMLNQLIELKTRGFNKIPMKKSFLVTLIFLFSASPTILASENKDSDLATQTVDSLFSDQRQIIKEIIGADVQLSEAEAKEFWSIYDSFERSIRPNMLKSAALLERYEGTLESISDSEADLLIDELINIMIANVEIQGAYIKKFREILPPKMTLKIIRSSLF